MPGHRDYVWPDDDNGDMVKVVPGTVEMTLHYGGAHYATPADALKTFPVKHHPRQSRLLSEFDRVRIPATRQRLTCEAASPNHQEVPEGRLPLVSQKGSD